MSTNTGIILGSRIVTPPTSILGLAEKCVQGDGIPSGAPILKMLPTSRLEDRFVRGINQECLVLHLGFYDFADSCKRNAFYHLREIWSDDDELVFFTAMQSVIVRRSG